MTNIAAEVMNTNYYVKTLTLISNLPPVRNWAAKV